MRTTNENEQIPANWGETEQTWQTGQKRAKKRAFLGKNKVKNRRNRAKNGQKQAKNGHTKLNPGETGRNRKFRRMLVRDRHPLLLTVH